MKPTRFEERFAAMPWFGKAAFYIALLPFWVVLGVIGLPLLGTIALIAVVGNWVQERQFRTRMRRAGRLLNWRDASARMAAEGGTLIIESPSLGWGYTRAWWTPENVRASSPFAPPNAEETDTAAQDERGTPWDQWCFDNLTSSESGRAFLVQTRSSKKRVQQIAMLFPNLEIVETWTAWASFHSTQCELSK